MIYSNGKIAGILFFIAASQFILGLIVAEALYPGYSISTNYISDLGIGPSSTIFNVSIFLTGLLSIIGTYFLHRAFHHKVVTLLLTISALAAMCVGIFTENSEPMHTVASFFVFLFGGLSAHILVSVNETSVYHYSYPTGNDESFRVDSFHRKYSIWDLVSVEWNV